MERIIIKPAREPYEKDEDIRNLLCYIAGECDSKKEHTRYCCGEGVSLKPEKAARQMILVQKAFKKAARKSGKRANRRIYHYMVSFPPSMDDANCAKLAAMEIAGIFPDNTKFIMESTKIQCVYISILRSTQSVM